MLSNVVQMHVIAKKTSDNAGLGAVEFNTKAHMKNKKIKSHSLKILKVCIPLILIGIGLFTLSLAMDHNVGQELSEHGKVLYGTAAKIGKKIGKKYRMSFNGTGGGATPEGIWLLSISFERIGSNPQTENEARKLIIQCVDDVLETINNDKELKPFLKNYPFTAENLELDIFNYDKNRDSHLFPSISIVTNSQGKIGFLTEDPSTKCGYHTKKYETYDQAVAILKKQQTSLD